MTPGSGRTAHFRYVRVRCDAVRPYDTIATSLTVDMRNLLAATAAVRVQVASTQFASPRKAIFPTSTPLLRKIA